MIMRHGRKFYLVSNRRLHLGCTPFFLLSSIFLRKISYFRSYGDKFWYHHVKKTFVIICVYSMKIDKNDVKFVILSTSIYDLVLIHVCHFHHHQTFLSNHGLSRYSCLHLGSLHPRNFDFRR